MALGKIETDTELTYSDPLNGYSITVKKDADNLDVRQVVPVSLSDQTWEDLAAYLDTKVGL